MAVKCNIVNTVLSKLYSIQYGLECKDYSNAIAESFIETYNEQGCSVDFVPCTAKKGDCDGSSADKPTYFICKFNIERITIVSKTVNTIVFGVETVGGKAPYEYNWGFDISGFNLSGPINQDTLTLTVKEGKDINLLVSPVVSIIKDADGCNDIKNCTYTPTGMKCNPSYQPCPNIRDVLVFSKVTYCATPHTLTVTKKP